MADETILVIEDNEKNLKLVRDVLTFRGYKVVSAENAEDGLRLAGESPPDLVVMDIHLPGMSGIEALGELRANEATRRIPVLAFTASVMPQDRHTIYAEGKHWSFTRFAPDSRLKGFELLPNGSLVVLERTRNGAKDSLIASLRRVDLGSCPDGGPCATETLAVLPAGPDNFEGLALLDAKHMLLVSDDGGSATQGTSFVLVTRP